jgi:hypothetical protein
VFEVERLKLLMVLNGGAAVIWVGFLKESKTLPTESIAQTWPVLAWAIGTLLAAGAFHFALDTQRAYTQAYHNRRRLYEWRFLGEHTDREELAQLLSRQKLEINGVTYEREEEFHAAKADMGYENGKTSGKATQWAFGLGAGAFALGVGLAMCSMR